MQKYVVIKTWKGYVHYPLHGDTFVSTCRLTTSDFLFMCIVINFVLQSNTISETVHFKNHKCKSDHLHIELSLKKSYFLWQKKIAKQDWAHTKKCFLFFCFFFYLNFINLLLFIYWIKYIVIKTRIAYVQLDNLMVPQFCVLHTWSKVFHCIEWKYMF